MAAAAALLCGVNGAVSKTILSTGLSSERLAQVRSLGAAIGLFAVVAVLAPRRLRLTRRELPYIVVFGVVGLAFVQWFYFLAIHRLAIGVALLIEYLAPLLVALWARFAYHDPVRRRIWAALGLALAGLALIVNLFGGGASLSTAGVPLALGGAFAYALYVLLAEHVVGGRDAVSLSPGASSSRRSSGRCCAVVEVPAARADRLDLAARAPARGVAPGLGARGLDDRARDDRAVLPARQRPAAPLGDAGRDRRPCSSRSQARSSPGSGWPRGSAACSSSAPASCWRRSCWRRQPDSAGLQDNRLQIPLWGRLCSGGAVQFHAVTSPAAARSACPHAPASPCLRPPQRPSSKRGDGAPARDEPRPRPARARALRFDSHLQRAAPRAQPRDGRIEHVQPRRRSGAGCSSSRVTGSVAGENLAWGTGSRGTPSGIVACWLASPEHRANLLRPSFVRVGVGDLRSSFLGHRGAQVVTADFAG